MLRETTSPERKTVLVAGFVGSHLCDTLLEGGHTVLCVDSFLAGRHVNVALLVNHPHFRLIRHDVRQQLEVDERIEQVYNLACPASPPHYQADPTHTMMTSVVGTTNLLDLAGRHGARFLQASTSEVYGDPQQHPQREDYWGHVNCTGPRACYDEGKRAAETLCFDMLRAGNVDARVARIFNSYGPRMRPDDGRIVSNLIVQALRNEALTIYGNGLPTRSFCYVSDLVAGLMALMNVAPNPNGPVNLSNPAELTVADLANLVLALVPSSSTIVYHPRPTDDPQAASRTSRAPRSCSGGSLKYRYRRAWRERPPGLRAVLRPICRPPQRNAAWRPRKARRGEFNVAGSARPPGHGLMPLGGGSPPLGCDGRTFLLDPLSGKRCGNRQIWNPLLDDDLRQGPGGHRQVLISRGPPRDSSGRLGQRSQSG